MDIFELQAEKKLLKDAPLSERLKPGKLEDYVGQEHILGKGKLLHRAIIADKITSLILYGPPGTGKTSLAKVIANTTKSNFVRLNAVTDGLKELREVVATAKNDLGMYDIKTILFIDEIHRFNKAQQDALLPYVEKGTIVLIGATTENPYFEVNNALISRSMLFKLEPLEEKHIQKIIMRALKDKEVGFGNANICMDSVAVDYLANMANGDARRALNALELSILTTDRDEQGKINITIEVAQECLQKKHIKYDKNRDEHYDVVSAFIKSMRGSDPDAAIHYLSRMIYAGEDPKFIARRIVIAAAEDVGNADPIAILVANNAAQAVQFVGMPEARIILSQAAIYIACAPKSNASYMAINKALKDVEEKNIGGVPPYLRDQSYSGAKKLGHGVGYLYPHDYEGNYVKQQYLPDELIGTVYYEALDNGYEKKIKERLKALKNKEK
ncbi:replication-associated recombination protein A [Clostridium tagluense]|uniref:replication-associated recombination protein A n=1 Tax=Clostridium tagluense TaxID=360422 RepID=UPI001CF235BD|nr:replication-associated recombination protein A [Clostridium tagluense]MCB2311755.1 replication-associated recombination protein A [Clostridium tagluense]MCB2316523.1 replication-associated recombination protein A [Clostridium tagluense]MCB2321335.1 replication-associated recombination protein A [Clostridium tagluense]MCB2326392.1 replication-associated recombination protein A [Clostridium tagluense]MCB2331115.1 replication-associated recombination protein A [Clostridium tagluense]